MGVDEFSKFGCLKLPPRRFYLVEVGGCYKSILRPIFKIINILRHIIKRHFMH